MENSSISPPIPYTLNLWAKFYLSLSVLSTENIRSSPKARTCFSYSFGGVGHLRTCKSQAHFVTCSKPRHGPDEECNLKNSNDHVAIDHVRHSRPKLITTTVYTPTVHIGFCDRLCILIVITLSRLQLLGS